MTKRYGDLTAVDAISLQVGQGEVYGVLGPNGAGKTTFLRMLFGLVRPDSGEIRLFGRHHGAVAARPSPVRQGRADHGPGADWICLMQWHDPNIDATLLPGKFELNVKSNDCYTAGRPSKIVGLLTITDTHGNDVPNPVFEFDSGSLTLSTSALVPDGHGEIRPALSCSATGQGCAGRASAKLGGRSLGTRTYAIAAGKESTLRFTLSRAQRHAGGTLTVSITPVIGTASNPSIAVPVAAG